AERVVQLARRLERLGARRLELPGLLEVPQCAIDAAEVLVPQPRRAPVLRGAPLDDLGLAATVTGGAPAPRIEEMGELGQLGLDDLDRERWIAGLDDLEQSIGRPVVGRIEVERGAQVLDRCRGLTERGHRLAGLGPRVRGADRVALVRRPGRAYVRE